MRGPTKAWNLTCRAIEQLMRTVEALAKSVGDNATGGYIGELFEAQKRVRELREHVENSEECEEP